MAKGQAHGSSGILTLAKGWGFDVGGIARKLKNGWAFDAQGLARRIFTAETPLEISYTGTYTDEMVTMSDGTYRLLTLSGSGTLTFNQQVECDIWACGGGGGGGKHTAAAGGGGGGFSSTALAAIIQNLTISIGAGGANSVAGSATTVTGDVELTSSGGGKGLESGGGAGGSGGGGRGRSGGYTGGNGQGSTTRPFADATLPPYCAGGGGGSYSGSYTGGTGGSDGSDGGAGSDANSSTPAPGGYLGGGSGSPDTGTKPGDATAWGGGGGGARSGVSGNTGSGYQGCVMVRIPYSGGGSVTPTTITFTIGGTTYTAEEGMTWAEWCSSSYNTGGFAVVGNYIEANSEYVYEKSTGIAVAPTGAINANGVYLTTL